MISKEKIDELYRTISEDLIITQFSGESDKLFHDRLIYSALGKWILSLFSDRDFEDDNYERVSKTHVTTVAMSIIESYKKIDPELFEYFVDDKKLVNLIENVYVRLGYVKSGLYTYKKQSRKAHLAISNRTLDIDMDSKINKTRGLGSWRKQVPEDLDINDFLLVKGTAENYTKKLIAQLKFSKFNPEIGKNEIYNIYQNRWEYFSERTAKTDEYSIVKVDDGLDYKIIKVINGYFYSASLPIIYTKQSTDHTFIRDIWRIILGLCSMNGCKAKCILKHNENGSILVKFCGFVLPSLEDAILRCMSWPIGNCLNHTEFITDKKMVDALYELLTKLSIDINGEY